MGEHRKKSQCGHELILNLLFLLSYVFRQMMKPQHEDANDENEQHEKYSHDNQQLVGLPRLRNKPWHMCMGKRGIGSDHEILVGFLRHFGPDLSVAKLQCVSQPRSLI